MTHHMITTATALLGGAAVVLAAAAAPAAAGSRPDSYDVPPPVSDISVARDGSVLAVGGTTVHRLSRGEVSTVATYDNQVSGLNGVATIGRSSAWVTSGGVDVGEGAAVLRVSRGGVRTVADIQAFELAEDPDVLEGPRWKDPRCEAEAGFTPGPQSNPYHLTARNGGKALVADAAGNTVLSVHAGGDVDWFALLTPPVDESGDYRVWTTTEEGVDCYVQPVPTSVAIDADGAVYIGELTGDPAEPGWSRVWRVEPGADQVVCPSSECSVALDGLSAVVDLAFGPDGSLYVVELDEGGYLAALGEAPAGGTVNRCDVDAGTCEPVAEDLPAPGAISFGKRGQAWVLLNGLGLPGAPTTVERLDVC